MRDIKPTPPKPSKPVAPKTESVTERMKKNAAQEFADLKEWYQSKRVEGHKDRDDSWLDGGVHNVAPLEKAIALGYDDIVCIACRPAKIGRGAFRGNLGSLGERISDVIAQTLLDADISQALKINDWVEIIQKVANLQSASLTNEEATALTTLRGKYKNVDVRLIRPKDELPFDMKTFTGGDIGTMIRLGRERAIPAMAKPLTSEEFKRLQALEGETAASA
jgi:hypothetical protein